MLHERSVTIDEDPTIPDSSDEDSMSYPSTLKRLTDVKRKNRRKKDREVRLAEDLEKRLEQPAIMIDSSNVRFL